MKTEDYCPICNEECTITTSYSEPSLRRIIDCVKCGKYIIADGAFGTVRNKDDPDAFPDHPTYLLGPVSSRARANLSAFVRERVDRAELSQSIFRFPDAFFKRIDQDNLGKLFFTLHEPPFHKKADLLLLAIEKQTPFAGKQVDGVRIGHAFEARAWACNQEEFNEILQFLETSSRISKASSFGDLDCKILPEGWSHLVELHKQLPDSQRGFIAMWFNDDLKSLDKILHNSIREAGYAPLRIDRKDHVNRIDDQIQVEIKSSRFVIADLTGQNPGVHFEAGYALGLGVPVIWTCRQQELDDKKTHFDVRQYNCLAWEDDPDKLEEFKNRLRWRIENICGRGRAVPSPDGEPPPKPKP